MRSRGVVATLRKAMRDHVFSRDHVLILNRPLSEPFSFRNFRMSGLTVTMNKEDEGIEILCRTYPDRTKVFREYIDQACVVAIAKLDQKAIGYVWTSKRDFFDAHLYRRTMRTHPGQFYVFAGFVHPEHRGKPVALKMMVAINDYYRERGYREASVAVAASNRESVRFHAKLRYVPTGEAFDSFELLGMRWTRDVPPRPEALAAYHK